MLVLLSPAKDMNTQPLSRQVAHSQPQLLKDAGELVAATCQLGRADLKRLMGINDKLADLNRRRFEELATPFAPLNAKPAAFAFAGDVYRGLEAASLDDDDLAWAQDHVRILSGLYGILRPLDLIRPYRLEMGLPLKTSRGDSLYEFWGSKLTRSLNAALRSSRSDTIVNLASKEYFAAVQPQELKARVVAPQFREIRDGKARSYMFFMKKARGLMARFIVRNRIEAAEALKRFDAEGYRFDPRLSEGDAWIFARPAAAKAKQTAG